MKSISHPPGKSSKDDDENDRNAENKFASYGLDHKIERKADTVIVQIFLLMTASYIAAGETACFNLWTTGRRDGPVFFVSSGD